MGGVSALMITLRREDAKGFRAEAQRTQSRLRQSGRMSGQHMSSGSVVKGRSASSVTPLRSLRLCANQSSSRLRVFA